MRTLTLQQRKVLSLLALTPDEQVKARYVEAFGRCYPQRVLNVRIAYNGMNRLRPMYRVSIDGESAGDPLTMDQMISATDDFNRGWMIR